MRHFDYQELKRARWDTEIVTYIARIYDYRGRQTVYLREKPAELERLVKIARIQSTEDSNRIEGIVTTNIRLKQLLMDKTTPKNRDEEEIAGYRDVLNLIHESYPYIAVDSSHILQLHRNLYQYADVEIGGRFKNAQNYIAATDTDGRTYILFTPPAPWETEPMMNELCENYRSAIDSGIDPLLVIPVFIKDFLCIHPFTDGNGRMSRLLTALLLYQNGFDVGKYISLESRIARTKETYYSTLQECSRGWYDGESGREGFVKYMLGVILAAYRDLDERLSIIESGTSAQEKVDRAVKGTIGRFTKRQIMELCPDVGRASVENSLRKLCEEGVIVRCGSGRSTFYVRGDAMAGVPADHEAGGEGAFGVCGKPA